MWFTLVFSALVTIGTCTEVTAYEVHGSPVIPDIRPEDIIDDLRIDATKMKYFFSRKGSAGSTEISSTNVEKLLDTKFNASLESVFIIHGWLNSNSSSINKSIRDALRKNYQVNIFVVDWSAYSRLDYLTAVTKTKGVGGAIANFIKQIGNKLNVELNKVRLVGFSLGAHVAGFAGKSLGGNLASIFGLDPAGPGFFEKIPSRRLNSTDAEYVQAIHTNAGVLGCNYSVGDSDFWPNGGKSQPGCALVDAGGICSHNRVHALYTESLGTNRFLATKCDSYPNYELGECRDNEISYMGGLEPNTTAKGDYFLTTNRRPPYEKN